MNENIDKPDYLVSVCMTSYYHEKYIAQAINSVLSQKTDFLYEIVICDDCSKDRTQQIILEYAKKNSNIRYKFNERNLGLTQNAFQAKCMCNGKYFLQLSGDDYWIDDLKLKKQVEFLENHGEYIGVGTRIESRIEDSEQADFIVPSLDKCNRAFTLKEFLGGVNFPTNGFLMRNVIKDNYDLFALMPQMSPYIDDETDCILILRLGNVYIMDEPSVAYRRRIEKEGEHNFNSINRGLAKFEKHIILLNNLYQVFGKEYDLFGRYKIALGPEIVKHYRRGTKEKFKQIIDSIPEEYKRRGLIVRSMLYDVPKAFEVITRSYKK